MIRVGPFCLRPRRHNLLLTSILVLIHWLPILSDNGTETRISERNYHDLMPKTCQPSKFRTIDGSCNNMHNSDYGKNSGPYVRFLVPDYGDGRKMPRLSKSGKILPNPRLLSTAMAHDKPVDNPHITNILMIWGQFINHEMTNKPEMKDRREKELDCCGKHKEHPECYAIPVPENDYYYSKIGIKCIGMARSVEYDGDDFKAPYREHVNKNTAYIDGSAIYGSDRESADKLRSYKRGRLRSTPHPSLELLPSFGKKECRADRCFKAGDFRANMFPALTSIHTLWLREHNRLAYHLCKMNPHWKDERIYQEARKIVGAELQHITYKEFLPLVLGPSLIKHWGLELSYDGYYVGYDHQINPAIAASFSSAAFRFGHSLVQPKFLRMDANYNELPSPWLSDEFDHTDSLYNFELDSIVRGLVTQHTRERDQYFSKELTNHLFENKTKPGSGQDLFAINIQRGRDNGLPAYNFWRKYCDLEPIHEHKDFMGVVPTEVMEALKDHYEHVDDVDLYPAGVSEYKVPGGLVGPTFGCIIGKQFNHLRRGDRFWYENGDHKGAFTPDQLAELRKVSLARIICDNTKKITKIQMEVMKDPHDTPVVDCNDPYLPKLDLSPWKDQRKHQYKDEEPHRRPMHHHMEHEHHRRPMRPHRDEGHRHHHRHHHRHNEHHGHFPRLHFFEGPPHGFKIKYKVNHKNKGKSFRPHVWWVPL